MAEFALVASHHTVSDSELSAIADAMTGRPRILRPRPGLAIVVSHADWENAPDVQREESSGSFVLGPHQRIATNAPPPESLLTRTDGGRDLDWPFLAGAWDDRRARLIVDPIGARPAWWASVPGATIVASTLKAILAHPKMSVEPNLGVLFERLSFRPSTPTETIYAGIQLVPAGHMLDIGVGRRPVQLPWHRWDFTVLPRSTPIEEIAEGIAETTSRLLADDMARRSSETCTLHLSGGLDSSSLAGLLAEQGNDEGMVAAMRRFPGLPTDESTYQDAVLAGRKFTAVHANPVPFDLERDLIEPTRRTGLAQIRHDPAHAIASREFASAGRRTAFIGEGGDELYGLVDASLAGFATGRAWGHLKLHAQSRSLRQHLSEHLEFFPEAVQKRRIAPRPWIRPELAERSAGHDRIVERTSMGERGRQNARLQSIIGTGWYALAAEARQQRLSELGSEEISVFLHPELVQHALSIPDALRVSADDARALQRQAFAHVLPPALIRRRGKVHFDHRHALDLESPEVDELLRDMSLHRAGIVDQAVVRHVRDELLAAFNDPSRPLPPLAGPLWAVIGHEVWWAITFGS